MIRFTARSREKNSQDKRGILTELRNRRWRLGNTWGVTIIAEGDGEADERGRRADDELVAVAQSKDLAGIIIREHNDWLEMS